MNLNLKNSVFIVADTNQVYAHSVVNAFNSLLPKCTVLIANDLNQILQLLNKHSVTLLITDVFLNHNFILNHLPQFLKIQPQLKILINASLPEEIYAVRCISAGAHGYVDKNNSELLLHAIQQVLLKDKFLSDHIKNLILNSYVTNNFTSLLQKLSNRELQIAQLWYNGITNEQIAALLNLQTSSLKTYKSSIFKKTQVTSYLQLFQLFDL